MTIPFKIKTTAEKFFLLCLNLLTIAVTSKSQSFTEKADGRIIKSNFSFYNSERKKESSAAGDYIHLYQNFISGIRGNECPMYPSCSNYGLKTFSETNFVNAFILTSDRMMRCGHDHRFYALTPHENNFKLLDYPAYDSPPTELMFSHNRYYFAFADTSLSSDSIQLIIRLINNGFYREALIEIIRYEMIQPFNVSVFINKMICLRAIDECEKAIFDFEIKCPAEHKSNPELLFQMAMIHYRLSNFDKALPIVGLALNNCNKCNLKTKLLMAEGLLYAHQSNWKESKRAFTESAADSSYRQNAEAAIKEVNKAMSLRRKNPTVAGVMSIVPGAGYAYTGHTQTAITAFLVNGLLAYATYSNFNKKNTGMGILTGIVNVSFYFGNIFGAAESAKRYNLQKKQTILDKLELYTDIKP